MTEYIINGAQMLTREQAHAEIARAMGFTVTYGNNLDALWDMLTTVHCRAVLKDSPAMLNALGGYGCRLLKTFFDAALQNPRFEFAILP